MYVAGSVDTQSRLRQLEGSSRSRCSQRQLSIRAAATFSTHSTRMATRKVPAANISELSKRSWEVRALATRSEVIAGVSCSTVLSPAESPSNGSV